MHTTTHVTVSVHSYDLFLLEYTFMNMCAHVDACAFLIVCAQAGVSVCVCVC